MYWRAALALAQHHLFGAGLSYTARWLSFVLAAILLAAPAQPQMHCGHYGFTCVGRRSLRLCRRENDFGPAFLCPHGHVCSEESLAVCERPAGGLCLRGGRVLDPSVPGCTTYVVCMRRGADFTSERFTCPRGTLFNGATRTCTPPGAYRCPQPDATLAPAEREAASTGAGGALDCGVDRRALWRGARRAALHGRGEPGGRRQHVGYSCPPRARAGAPVVCTVYSELFCVALERDERDQFSFTAAAFASRARPAPASPRPTTPYTRNPPAHTASPPPHQQEHTHITSTENTMIQNNGPVRTLFLTIR